MLKTWIIPCCSKITNKWCGKPFKNQTFSHKLFHTSWLTKSVKIHRRQKQNSYDKNKPLRRHLHMRNSRVIEEILLYSPEYRKNQNDPLKQKSESKKFHAAWIKILSTTDKNEHRLPSEVMLCSLNQ